MKNFLASILNGLATVRSASRVVAAIQFHAKPERADLERLGIDPARFARIRQA